VTREAVNIKELVLETTQHLKFMDGIDKEVFITTDIADDLGLITDRNRMSVILNNLISNAIRYSDPEKAHAYVAIKATEEDGTTKLVIEDNGIGIDADKQHKVFDMFYRISNRSVGSGLGLYIVKETVEKLHGSISLVSEPGAGTSFSITLPNIQTTLKHI
jgi:signal transduction histidine kinase